MVNSPRSARLCVSALLILLFAVSTVSCSKTSATVQTRRPDHAHDIIPPQASRITATVLAVLPPAVDGSASPCAQHPCHARIRVDSVLGYGQGFSSALSVGDTLTVFFEYTLADTRTIFPDFQQHFPGLRPGDTFRALVYESRTGPVINSGEQADRYTITAYKRMMSSQ